MPYSFAAHLARFGPEARYPVPSVAAARSYCAQLTRAHYENFSVASIFLPRRLAFHFHPIYAYCRWADDLGDETGGGQQALDLLEWWRHELLEMYGGRPRHPVMVALRPTVERFQIPPAPFLDLLNAFAQDQRVKSYPTFESLLGYCRNSANPVGRLVLHLGESFDDERARLSDLICTGLQLANFWQDVRRDWVNLQRVYIPEEDLLAFGVAANDLQAGRCTPAFRELMKFEVERTRAIFDQGQPLLGMIPRSLRRDVGLFLEGGRAILRKIETVGYDVLTERPRLSKWEKARIVFGALGKKEVIPQTASVTRSFAFCHDLAKRTARNFYLSFLVLPRPQRRAMDALYAFMRLTDDLADEPGEISGKRCALASWRLALDRCLVGVFSHPLHPALHQIVAQFGIPAKHLREVIDGVEMDLEPVRFDTFADLHAYCYRVASAVGLCCIHIWGFRDDRAIEYAEAAGIALQLTNILRDLGEDFANGRVYLPQEDLERFQCPPASWPSNAFREMMRFQLERARDYYRKAEGLMAYLSPAGQAIFQAMLHTYRGLLEEIERRDYDVFRERVRLSGGKKLRQLLLAVPRRWGWS